MTEPMWLERARDMIGVREISGHMHEPKVLQLWRDAKMPVVQDDETAWCAAFVGAMLERSMITSTRKPNARSYQTWGIDVLANGVDQIPIGAVCVFSRPPNDWQGHVAFAVGVTPSGALSCVGGNQSNSVSIAPFNVTRLVAARWPVEERDNLRILTTLPKVMSDGRLSENEA